MNLKQAITLGTQKLSHLENPKLEAEILLCSVMGSNWNRTKIKTKDDQTLTVKEQGLYRWRVYKRSKHIPTAYVTGRVEWNGLHLAVCQATLIPRDETETLCHHIAENYELQMTNEKLRKNINQPSTTLHQPSTILDIGTGSGCIAISLAKQWPKAAVSGVDISRRALQYAVLNAKANHTNITFKRSHLISSIPNHSHINLIVANLPYVPNDLIVTPEVDKEPHNAIFSGADGLDLIRELSEQLKHKKITFNQLWLEFLPESQKAIETIFNDFEVTFYRAINGEIFFACVKNPLP